MLFALLGSAVFAGNWEDYDNRQECRGAWDCFDCLAKDFCAYNIDNFDASKNKCMLAKDLDDEDVNGSFAFSNAQCPNMCNFDNCQDCAENWDLDCMWNKKTHQCNYVYNPEFQENNLLKNPDDYVFGECPAARYLPGLPLSAQGWHTGRAAPVKRDPSYGYAVLPKLNLWSGRSMDMLDYYLAQQDKDKSCEHDDAGLTYGTYTCKEANDMLDEAGLNPCGGQSPYFNEGGNCACMCNGARGVQGYWSGLIG